MTHWTLSPADDRAVDTLAVALGVPRPVARMLAVRGYADPAVATSFLDSGLGSLGDPFVLDGMQAAVDRLRRALAGGERIAIYGDYDADGVTSTVLLVRTLRALGATVEPFLPNRFDEGYGLSTDGLRRCIETIGPKLIVTADCGSCSGDAVRAAASEGVDTIVTDHHEIRGDLACPIVVNPKKSGDPSLSVLAGVGVAFKLAHALVKSLRVEGHAQAGGIDLRRFLDLVAVGTVADVAPLCGENRVLVRSGLNVLNGHPCAGLAALMERARVRMPADARQIGFIIGPRLNAAGRLSDVGPEEALALLMADTRSDAMPHADRLERANQERRRIEAQVLEQALEQAPAERDPPAVTVGREGWHVGTIGIVAARLCGRFRCPSAVIALESDGSGKGSCRSVEGVNIVDALSDCAEHLETYGGHAMAAGLRLKAGSLCAFREAFGLACRSRDTRGGERSPVRIDAWIGLDEANGELLAACRRCEPFGIGNPAPLWGARGLNRAGEVRVVGGEHLAFRLSDGRTTLPAIAFYKSDATIGDSGLEVAFRVAEDSYNGHNAIQLQVVAWKSGDGSDNLQEIPCAGRA